MAYPWSANDILTAADLNAAIGTGIVSTGLGAWTTYTPTLTQTATVTKTVSSAAYMKIGRGVIGQATVSVTGAGTAGAQVRLGLPMAAAHNVVMASGYIYDSSTTTRYVVSGFQVASAVLAFVHDTSAGNIFGTTPAVTLASGDILDVFYMFEAVS